MTSFFLLTITSDKLWPLHELLCIADLLVRSVPRSKSQTFIY